MKLALLVALLAATAFPQTPPAPVPTSAPAAAPAPRTPSEQRKAIEELMAPALAKQKTSVLRQFKQVPATVDESSGFFTVPFPADQPMPALKFTEPIEPLKDYDEPLEQPLQPQASYNPTEPCRAIDQTAFDSQIREAAQREGYSADLLRAVIQQESGFDPCAVSRKGALGLMQLMPSTASDYGVTDPFDPIQNLNAGARFLGQLLTRYGGDLSLALGAYNAGPSKVDSIGAVPAIPETQNYVRSILGALPTTPSPLLPKLADPFGIE